MANCTAHKTQHLTTVKCAGQWRATRSHLLLFPKLPPLFFKVLFCQTVPIHLENTDHMFPLRIAQQDGFRQQSPLGPPCKTSIKPKRRPGELKCRARRGFTRTLPGSNCSLNVFIQRVCRGWPILLIKAESLLTQHRGLCSGVGRSYHFNYRRSDFRDEGNSMRDGFKRAFELFIFCLKGRAQLFFN